MSITDFSTTATQQVPYTTVTQDSIDKVFAPYLKNGYEPGGWTNWEAAFQVVEQANAAPGGTKADMVFFITDGDPTARNTATGTVTGLAEGDVDGPAPRGRGSRPGQGAGLARHRDGRGRGGHRRERARGD